jgi:hypothetical protein
VYGSVRHVNSLIVGKQPTFSYLQVEVGVVLLLCLFVKESADFDSMRASHLETLRKY